MSRLYKKMENKLTNQISYPFVSVIVPVYNDAQRIGKCIESLLNQTYPREKYEILIIDNGSTDETRDVVKKYPVTLLIEDKIQSSYGARNKGIKNAQGEVIAFTDSDCIPADEWIKNGVTNLLKTENCGLVAGEIDIFFRKPNTPNAVELYDSIMGFNQKRDIEHFKFGSTANVFTFKKVIDNVGQFNEKLQSGGDNEWGRRVYAHGYTQVYADDTRVAHPARYSFGQLYKRMTRLIGGCYEQYWENSSTILIKSLVSSMKKIPVMLIRLTFGMSPAESLKRTKEKIQFIIVVIFVEVVTNWEKIRLVMGGSQRDNRK